jgi:hypothetical protein
MNRNTLLAIAVLAMVGTGLGIVSAQWMAPQSPVEDTVLYSEEVYGNSNGTGVTMVTIRAGKISIGGAFEPPRELTPEEKQEAIDIALADSEVQELLDGREYEIRAVSCMPSLRGHDMRVSVRIGIMNAPEDGPDSILALVDPDEKIVVEVAHIATLTAAFSSSGPMPLPIEPLTPDEEEHAIDIALSDPDVQELLDGREYNVSRASSIPTMLKMEHWDISHHHLDDAVNGTDSEYGVQEISLNTSSDRYASVRIDILNESENMTAYMTVVVNLNESIMERLGFEMSRGGGLMMSHSMPVMTTMTCGSYIAGTYEINDSDNAGGMGYGISIFDAEP